jgi:hypothetical protein
MRKVLRAVRAGGLLVMTQGTTDRQWREKPRFMLAGTSEDVSRVVVIDYLNGGARYNVLDIEHGKRRGLHVWSVEYPCIFLSDDYRDLLNEAGFREIVMYGGYGFEPYDKEGSDRLIIVAGN